MSINSQTNEYPIMSVLARNPLMASTISKAMEQPVNIGASTIRDAETGALASMGELYQISRYIQQEIQNFESFFQLFPDMNIDRLIMLGAILAPNNMFREELNFSIESDWVDSVLASEIIKLTDEHVANRYNFIGDLRKIVDNAMFNFGSHVKLVIPEAAVDYLINDGGQMRHESFSSFRNFIQAPTNGMGLGLLGNPGTNTSRKSVYRSESYQTHHVAYNPNINANHKRWSGDAVPPQFASLIQNGLITITDDPSIVKLPHYQKGLHQELVRSRIDSQRTAVTNLRHESFLRLEEAKEKLRLENGGTPHNNAVGTPGVNDDGTLRGTRVTHYEAKPDNTGALSMDHLRAAVFKAAPTDQRLFQRVPRLNSLSRHSIGACLCVDAPSEAFIPVHYPGQPDRHVGYFGLLDTQSGYFITKDTEKRYNQAYGSQSGAYSNGINTNTGNPNNAVGSGITEKAKENLLNADRSIPLRFHPEIFGSLLVEEFLERLRYGMDGFEVEAKMADAMAYVMMARANAGHQTQVVYFPREYVSYFAFDHNANGTGRSLLAGVQNLLSLRAAALYSRVANQIRNAISITDVNVTMDPRDHQPQRTLTKIVDLVTQSRAQFFPWGLNTASDIWAWWNRAGYQLNVEGHPALPTTKVQYEQRAHDHNIPDIADDSYLADMVGHHIGITPEMKDAGKGAEFATSIVNNNILFANRAHGYQLLLNPQITDHYRRLMFNDSDLFTSIRSKIKERWATIMSLMEDKKKAIFEGIGEDEAIDAYMRMVVDSFKAVLPPPEVTTIQNQYNSFKEYTEAVDHAFDQILADGALAVQIFGEDAPLAQQALAANRAQIKRDWMQKQGYLDEVFEIASLDTDGKPNSRLHNAGQEFAKGFAFNLKATIQRYKGIGAAIQKDFRVLSGEEQPEDQNVAAPTDGQPPEQPAY